MHRLGKRVAALEDGMDPGEVMVMGTWPRGVTEERFRAVGEDMARQMGYDPPFRFDASCTGEPGGDDDIRFIFIGATTELKALLDDIAAKKRRITDR